jgi:hypothetical protein
MSREPVRFEASTREHAESLRDALEQFPVHVVDVEGSYQVELTTDDELSARLVELFDTVGAWLTDANLGVCQVHFGDRSLSLVAQPDGGKGDPTQFLLERTRQLQKALDTRVIIEQAKGVLAERYRLEIDEAFELLRGSARRHAMKIHLLAQQVVDAPETPSEIQPPL